ncbi:MAG: PAS domain S-box protein [Chitinophagaceae bacterium]|nr:MAG: PAS domain S-box protein [Chitinophagaceae bacterium]
MLFIAEDITEQFKSAEEIKQLRQLQRETESLLGFGVFTYDLSNGETEWSDGIYHLLEHAPDKEGPGLTFEHYLNYITEPDRQMLQNVMQRSIEAKSTFTATYHILTEKNKRKVISTRGKLVLADDGSVDKVVGSMLDITEEVARQEELEAFKLNMDEKEQFLDFGSWEEEMPEGNVTWSDGMYRLFGYDPDKDGGLLHINEELYKKHLSTEDWERSVRIRLDALDHQDDFSAEFNIVTAAGSSRRLQTFAKVIRDQQNQVVKIIGTTRDITQLRAYERNLESIVNDLNRSNKDLEEFAYIASHDLQEPLRKLSTFSERLISRHGAELGPEGKKYTERILAATDNMRILIENLLEDEL